MALSSKEGRDAMKLCGVQLMVLAHKYRIGWLKRECEVEVNRQLRVESVVDVLQIARLCDSSRLYQSCRRLIAKEFVSVQLTDGWKFVRLNDPRLASEILQFVQDTEQRAKRWRKQREEAEMYRKLSEAMDCLEHICVEGCTSVGPHDKAVSNNKGPCSRFETCEGLQLLIRHFAACNTKKDAGTAAAACCAHCKRMWQFFRLHASLCGRGDSCRVPLCKKFKLRMQMDGKGDDATWRLLVKRVGIARVMCSLAMRKRPDQLRSTWAMRSYKSKT